MSDLARMAGALGGVLLLLYVPLVVIPEKSRALLMAFPRSKWAAWFLTAIALFWSWHLIDDIHLGRLEAFKKWLPVLTVVAYGLIVTCMDDLLAPRALGGILLLVPAPILAAVRVCDSPWRHIVAVLVYVLVVKGILLVLNPFLFREWLERLAPDAFKFRLLGGVGIAVSITLIVLALTAY